MKLNEMSQLRLYIIKKDFTSTLTIFNYFYPAVLSLVEERNLLDDSGIRKTFF